MTDLPDWEIVGREEHPPDADVKLNGPPGTGKTTQAALRVGLLLDDYGYTVDDLLWATYRRSLARETLERLADWGLVSEAELAKPTKGPTRYISTIHAVANRMVGDTGDVVDGSDKYRFARKRGLRYKKRNPWDEPPGRLLFDVFEYAAENLLDLHDDSDRREIPMLPDLQRQYPGDVGRAWDDWQDYKQSEGKIDFWEQLAAPLRQNIDPPHSIVVVDEYHDVTPLRAKVAERWLAGADVAIVAGDPLQAIYNFSGAHPQFFEELELPEILLPTAHERPPREHWAPATRLLSEAHTPPSVEIQNSGSFHQGASPTFRHSENGWSVPSEEDARSPAWLVDQHGTDTMFLTRTRMQADGVAAALEKAGILFETQASMDVEGWGAQEGISERTALYNALQKLRGAAPVARSRQRLDAYTEASEGTGEPARLRAREAAAILDHASAQYLTGTRADTTEIADRIDVDGTVVSAPDLAPHVEPEFWDVYGRGHGSVRHLISSSATAEGESISDRDREAMKAALKRNSDPVLSVDTKVFTIHASKGTEARNVVLYDGITRKIQEQMERRERERQNEFRTWYVALTRSRANLFVLRGGFEYTVSFLPESLIESAQAAHREAAR